MNLQKLVVVLLCIGSFACATRTKPAPIDNVTTLPSYLQHTPPAAHKITTQNSAAVANNTGSSAHMAALAAAPNSEQSGIQQGTTTVTVQSPIVDNTAANSGAQKSLPQPAAVASEQQLQQSADQSISSDAVSGDGQSWVMPTHHGKITQYKLLAKGIDIYGTEGQGVYAVSDGKVVYSGNGLKGYGNLIIIKHNATYLSAYAHNKVNLVQEGATVTRGQKIATMGDNDNGKAMLHFELRKNGKPIDPFSIIKR